MAGPIKPTESERATFAVCPRDLIRDPKLFGTKAEAERFLRSEILPGSIDAQPIRNEDQGWQDPVPVRRIADYHGPVCNRTFREFLPPDKVAHSMPALNMVEEIEQALEGQSGDGTCYLDADCRFDEIGSDARRRVGHKYTGRRHGSIVEIVLGALYDLEAAFQKFHPEAPCAAVADFWRSWQIQRHIGGFCSRLGDSDAALRLTGNRFVAAEEAEQARVNVCRQLAAFAHEVVDGCVSSSAENAISEPKTDVTRGKDAESADNGGGDRRAAVDAFLLKCKKKTPLVIRTHIWRAVGHRSPRQFQYWQASDPRATAQDDENFRRILAMDPADFVNLLKEKGII